MPNFDLKRDGLEITNNIKFAKWFPVDTGNLRDNATTGNLIDENTFLIKFDESVAKYIKYLEEGTINKNRTIGQLRTLNTRRINNLRGFGVPAPITQNDINIAGAKFGKHMGFISDKTINYILDYFVKKYKGTVEKI